MIRELTKSGTVHGIWIPTELKEMNGAANFQKKIGQKGAFAKISLV